MVLKMLSWEELWLTKFNHKGIPQANIHPNVTVFNRKVYTFGGISEVYLKIEFIDQAIKYLNELAHVDTNSCMIKVADNTFIVVLRVKQDSKEYAVIGNLNDRYVTKNNLQ